ncbi:MAG TPA: hypothetical protein VFA18_18670, partial [Gemmataceae bacterium]|nr:hypothetical protein [Gemmataceae bacterium]
GTSIGAILQHKSGVNDAIFSPDGRYVATASSDSTARVWNAATGLPVTPPLAHTNYSVNRLAFSPVSRQLVTAGSDNTARVWDVTPQTRAPRLVLRADVDMDDVAFSHDGRWILTAGYHAVLWDARTGQKVRTPSQRTGVVKRASFSPHSKRFITTDLHGKACIWSAATGQLQAQVQHGDEVRAATFSHDGLSIVTASDDQTARVWDSATGQPLTPPLHHTGAVRCASFSPDGRYVLTASDDHTARLWDLAGGQEWCPVKMTDRTASIQCSADGQRWLAVRHGTNLQGQGEVSIWDRASGPTVQRTLRRPKPFYDACFSPDGLRVATVGADGTAQVWDAVSGTPITPPLEHDLRVHDITFSPDGRWVVTAAGSGWNTTRGEARVWDAFTGAPLSPVMKEAWPIWKAAISADGRRVLTSGDILPQNAMARLWDVASGKPITIQSGQERPLTGEFSPDGSRVVIRSYATARVYDAQTGQPLTVTLWHKGTVNMARFSPDGRLVATASNDRLACIWDATTGQLAVPPLQHSTHVYGVAFSPDSRLLATIADHPRGRLSAALVQFWDVATGEPVCLPFPCEGANGKGMFELDSQRFRLITSSTMQQWNLRPDIVRLDDLRSYAELLAGRQISDTPGTIATDPARLQAIWKELHVAYPEWFNSSPGQVQAWHWHQAERLRTARQWSALMKETDPLIDAQPHWWPLWLYRGEAWHALGKEDKAITALSRAIAWGAEGDSRVWSARAEAQVALKHWQLAADDYTHYLHLQPESPEWGARAMCYAYLGNWQKAAAGYAHALQLDQRHQITLSDNSRLLIAFDLALLRLALNDRRSYQQQVSEMLRQYSSPHDAETATIVSWTGTLAPDSVKDVDHLVTLARRATAARPNDVGALRSLGAALYRAGRAQEALKPLRQALHQMDAGQHVADRSYCLYYLALCEQKRAHAEAARQWLKQANGTVRQTQPLTWAVLLTQRLLRQEAEKIIAPAGH